MKAQFAGCTLIVYPENDQEREQLKYYGSVHGLWECFGIDGDGSLSVQSLCPVGLQDTEIADHVRYMLECDTPAPEVTEEALRARSLQDREVMDQIRQLLNCE